VHRSWLVTVCWVLVVLTNGRETVMLPCCLLGCAPWPCAALCVCSNTRYLIAGGHGDYAVQGGSQKRWCSMPSPVQQCSEATSWLCNTRRTRDNDICLLPI
jgi:hypothetical protein